MATATQFFEYWALAFTTLCVALILLNFFYRFIDLNLDLHSAPKEAAIAAMASAVQGAGFWLSASLFHGSPFRRLVIPGAIATIIYWLAHLKDWNGFEIGGIALFQAVILSTGLFLMSGEFTLAAAVLGVFVIGLAIIAGIARGL